MTLRDPYSAIDDVLIPWAKSRAIRVSTLYGDDIVRCFWVYDQHGNQRAQLWLGVPNTLNEVTLYVAEFKPELPAKWERSCSARFRSKTSQLSWMNLAQQHISGLATEPLRKPNPQSCSAEERGEIRIWVGNA